MRALLATTALALLAAAPARADVVLENAWMRPAHAGDRAAVYVDIVARAPMKLVAAATPVAARAEFVLVPGADVGVAKERVVGEVPIVAGTPVRFALGGSHLRLFDLAQDVRPGMSVPLTFTFVDARGRRHDVDTLVVVRGLTGRRPEPEMSTPDPQPPK